MDYLEMKENFEKRANKKFPNMRSLIMTDADFSETAPDNSYSYEAWFDAAEAAIIFARRYRGKYDPNRNTVTFRSRENFLSAPKSGPASDEEIVEALWPRATRARDFLNGHWEADKDDFQALRSRIFWLSSRMKGFSANCFLNDPTYLIGKNWVPVDDGDRP